MGALVISTKLSGDYKFEFTSRKGKVIFTGGAFAEKDACEAAIASLKENLPHIEFRRFRTAGGKFYFRLLLDEHVVAVSRKYSTELMLQKGIAEVEKALPTAEVLDFSGSDAIFG